MEFDNPAAGGQWGIQNNSGHSDFSDGDRESVNGAKKEKNLLGSSKKKDKEKKKEKETRYAHLGDESSNEEEDGKSTGKSKRKAFKIGLAKKDKKDKKEKDLKDQEAKESKENKKKEKEKKEKEKSKLKKKKSKPTDSESEKSKKTTDVDKWPPIFGVTLDLAVERNKCHDGVKLPVVVRECIDFIEEKGLNLEGIYRSSGVKSKVLKLRTGYNQRQCQVVAGSEPLVVASLLKLFLRELPDQVLTSKLAPSFEEVSTRPPQQRLKGLKDLLAALPECNLLLIQWVFVHMRHVIEREKVNKMTLQNVSIVLSPTMKISHRVLNCIFEHSSKLFAEVKLMKYIPPISGGVTCQLPESPTGIQEELVKQESLLAELHKEISSGLAIREEQLWEQQRIVTQLKRNLRLPKNIQQAMVEEEELNFNLQTPVELSPKENREISDNVNVDVEPAGGAAISSPEESEQQEEHEVTVQIHRDTEEVDNHKKEIVEDKGKGNVTVIHLNQDSGEVAMSVVDSATHQTKAMTSTSISPDKSAVKTVLSPEKAEVTIPKSPEKSEVKASNPPYKTEVTTAISPCKSEVTDSPSSVFSEEIPPSQDVTSNTNPIYLSSVEKPPETQITSHSVTIQSVSSTSSPPRDNTTSTLTTTIPKLTTSTPIGSNTESLTIQPPKTDVSVSFCSNSNLSARPPPSGSIPFLPPPPPSSRASSKSRSLAPPSLRTIKSKSLPRGMPSDGSVFDKYEQEEESSTKESEDSDESNKEALLLEEMRLKFEFEELLNLKSELERRKKAERREIGELQEEIATMRTLYQYRTYSVDSSEDSSEGEEGYGEEQREVKIGLLTSLAKQEKELQKQKVKLQAQLQEERAACLQLRVDIRMEQERIRRQGLVAI